MKAAASLLEKEAFAHVLVLPDPFQISYMRKKVKIAVMMQHMNTYTEFIGKQISMKHL